MKLQRFSLLIIFFLLKGNTVGFALDSLNSSGKQKLTFGLYIGALQANQYTASMYNGYGFDINGFQNSFGNSWMYQKISYEGGYIQGVPDDRIAEQLKVDYHTWAFDESDMPKNMNYAPGVNVGANFRYSVDENNAILINLNAARITARGNFTIQTPQPSNSTSINNTKFQTFSIIGLEQRLILMFGYQRILGGEASRVAPFIELGLNATAAKFTQNFIIINDLNIDLIANYNNNYYTTLPVRKPIGMGFGYYGGVGLNIKTNTKYSAQLVYNPSMEMINIGSLPQRTLQHYLGIRFYYNF